MAAVATAGTGVWSSTTPNAPWPGGTVPAITDTITINHAVTIDQNVTAGSDPGFGGTAAIAIGAVGTLQFDTTASRTLTLKGDLTMASGASLLIGAAGAGRVPLGTVITIKFNYSAAMASGKYGLRVAYSTTSVFKAYGLVKTNNTYLTQQDSSGQAHIHVNDATGWANGDIIEIAAINAAGGASANSEEKIIQSISGTDITLTGNLSVTHPANSYIINTTKNIVLRSYNTTNCWFADTRFGTSTNHVLDNVELDTLGSPSTAIGSVVGYSINGFTSGEPATGDLEQCTFYKIAAASGNYLASVIGPYSTGLTFNNCSFFNGFDNGGCVYIRLGSVGPVLSNCTFMKCNRAITIDGSPGIIGGTLSSCKFNGCITCLDLYSVAGLICSSNSFSGNTKVYVLGSGLQIDLEETSMSCGIINANTSVFAPVLNVFVKYNSFNPEFGASETLLSTPQSNISNLSYIQLNNATEGITGNVFTKYINTGSWYKDIAVYKNSPSSIRLDTVYAGASAYSFQFLAQTGVTYTIKVNLRYNGTYDDAAYTLPSVTISGLGITSVVATATTAALNAWEAFSLNVVQSSGADGLLTVAFSGQSATATGSAYFDGLVCPPFITVARFYGYNFDETIPTRTVNPWVDVSEATALAYTGIAINWTLKTLAITEAHTLHEIYDYSQAQLSAAANLTKEIFLTTADGINYILVSNWDITITNVIVTATDQALFCTGSGTYSVTGASGDFTGILGDAISTRVKIAITDIVDGSRIQLYDMTSAAELVNEIVSGTDFSIAFIYAVDHTIRLRLTYVDGATTAYYWHTQTGTVTATGLTFVAVQVQNTIYEEVNIDGSLVTECSISGTTIRIFIDDPDNTTTAQRIYNWYQYYLFTEDGIREQDGAYITATDSTHYIFDDTMKIENQDVVNPLNITGANITPETGAATNIFDLSNGASICLNFNRVEGFSYASGLSTAEHNALMAVPAATENADTLLDRPNAIETGLTLRQAHMLEAAAAAATLSGAQTSTVVIKNAVANSKPRITATVDAYGNRAAVVTDVSP